MAPVDMIMGLVPFPAAHEGTTTPERVTITSAGMPVGQAGLMVMVEVAFCLDGDVRWDMYGVRGRQKMGDGRWEGRRSKSEDLRSGNGDERRDGGDGELHVGGWVELSEVSVSYRRLKWP
jgi:hypothetical protein